MSQSLAQECARINSEGEVLHTKLKPTGDWSKMRDWYAHTFEIAKQVGEAKRNAVAGFASTYEALLDSYSRGMRDATIAREFGELEQALPALIKEAQAKQALEPAPLPLAGPFPAEQQAELCRRMVKAVGFDFTRGRFDMSPSHPSAGGTADDARITAKPGGDDFLSALFAAIHETGHANYNQNTPAEWRYQPAGSDLGMGVHESQSRIVEVQACHTPEFFQFLEKQVREVFNRPNDPALSAQNLERLVNRVEPSFIRIEADEITYPAHVILRYKLEKALVEGTMTIDELPKAWNDGMQQLLGITPSDPSHGHMQDVHWPTGAIGYFPAYTIGDMGAAQLFVAACKAKPDLRAELANGNFKPLNEWLKENVHSKGSLLTPEQLFLNATGEDLNAQHYLNHLSMRYLGKPYLQTPNAPAPAANMGGKPQP